MVVGDQATQDNNAQPNKERKHRQELNGFAMNERFFPQFFVVAESNLEDGGNQRPNDHKRHFEPKRKSHQFTDRLPDHHQDARRQLHAQCASQPRPKPACGLPQRLIHPGPSQDAEIDHEHGPYNYRDAQNVNGLNGWDYPSVVLLNEDAKKCCGEPFGKMFQVRFP